MNSELRNHIIRLLESGTRLDGRKLTDYRQPIKIEYGVSNTAEGSAKVQIGDTEVIAGVKVEISTPFPDTPEEGGLMVNTELLPLSSPDFESGPPGIEAIELARVVDRAIRESKAVDFKGLCIEKGEKAWFIMIDVISLNSSGNLLDAASLAAIAAVKDMRFPALNDEGKIEYKEKTDKKLGMKAWPLSVTVSKIGSSFIVDPDLDEEKVIDARLTVGSLDDGTLCSMQKGGNSPLAEQDILQMIDIAVEKAKELRKML
ncbi:exosome complex protein Rrp42 [Candidatus Woesearchaeota archaeon]|nr:exosome complex protein Rrp42 [Candidatus Woesearchaeota archaeon]